MLKLCEGKEWDCDSADGSIGWTYSGSLLAVLPTAFPAVYLLSRKNWLTTGFGVHHCPPDGPTLSPCRSS